MVLKLGIPAQVSFYLIIHMLHKDFAAYAQGPRHSNLNDRNFLPFFWHPLHPSEWLMLNDSILPHSMASLSHTLIAIWQPPRRLRSYFGHGVIAKMKVRWFFYSELLCRYHWKQCYWVEIDENLKGWVGNTFNYFWIWPFCGLLVALPWSTS